MRMRSSVARKTKNSYHPQKHSCKYTVRNTDKNQQEINVEQEEISIISWYGIFKFQQLLCSI